MNDKALATVYITGPNGPPQRRLLPTLKALQTQGHPFYVAD
jgi:hypothetical protein